MDFTNIIAEMTKTAEALPTQGFTDAYRFGYTLLIGDVSRNPYATYAFDSLIAQVKTWFRVETVGSNNFSFARGWNNALTDFLALAKNN